MIRRLKLKENYKIEEEGEKICYNHSWKGDKIFVNSENIIHNDVGPAVEREGSLNFWHWNGEWIR